MPTMAKDTPTYTVRESVEGQTYADGHLDINTVRENVGDVACGDGDRFTSEGMLVRVRIEGDEAHGFTVTNTVESAETLPATGVDSPVALAGAGLLVSVAGMAATWLVARRRTRNR